MAYNPAVALKTERGPIAEDFDRLHNARTESLDIVDRCAELVGKPWYASSRWMSDERNRRLYTPYQSTPTHAINHLTGVTAIAFFKPGGMWHRLSVRPNIAMDRTVPQQLLDDIEEELRMREFLYQSLLEASNTERKPVAGRYRRPVYDTTFFAAKIAAIDQIFVTGEVLEFLDDDFRLRRFAREQYVTERDSAGDVLLHVICELIDPLSLSPKQFAASGLDMEKIKEKRGNERQVALFTRVEYGPRSGKWAITQEVNGKTINEFADPVSPYMCSGLELGPRDDYHHGLVESYKGDIESMNELAMRLLDAAGMTAKMVPGIDYNSEVSEEDLGRRSGEPIRCRVEDGIVKDVAFLHTQKTADLSFAEAFRQGMENRLAKAMLATSDAVRRSERTTAFEIQNTLLAELQGVHGGIMARTQPGQQNQLIRRVDFQAKKQGLVKPLVKDEGKLIEYGFLTGPAALSRESEYQKLKEYVTDIALLAQAFPRAAGLIDETFVMRRLAYLKEINTNGVIKSAAQIAKEQEEQIKMLAAQQAIQSAGTIAEGAVAAGAQQPTAPQ